MKHMDYIYLDENYYKTKKEVHSFLINLLSLNLKKDSSILDIGCARGELLYHIKKDLKSINTLYGIDYSKDLIQNAKEQEFLQGINLSVENAEDFNLNRKFDLIVSAGLTGYFDSLDDFFVSISKHLKKDGKCFVLHLFNSFDIDVLVKYRNNKYFDEFQSGWNIHSINTAEQVLNKTGLKLENIHKFVLSFNDNKKDDPARSWTSFLDEDKKFVNGLGQVYDLICLEITR